MHGFVQIFGIHSRNHDGHCTETIEKGLSFVGWYENGIPVGQCWRQLIGGSWMYGKVDEYGHFTGKGKEVAYLYQDLELAMLGRFKDSLMEEGQEVDVISQTCNEHGIKVLEFSSPRGPKFTHLEPTNVTFGDQPNVRDPIAKKYIHLKDSDTYKLAGIVQFVDFSCLIINRIGIQIDLIIFR